MDARTFVTEIVTLLGSPRSPDPDRYIGMIRAEAEAFNDAEREATCENFIAEWTYARWPKPAEIRKMLGNSGAKLAPKGQATAGEFVRNRHWKSAREYADGWWQRNPHPWLTERAEQEGWTEDLENVIITMAHSCYLKGVEPEDEKIKLDPLRQAPYDAMSDAERMEYYAWKRRAYRLANWVPPQKQHGRASIDWTRAQSAPGEAIQAATKRSETR